MKKYLMTGIAALAMGGMFTSCSHDMSLYSGSQSEQVLQKYEDTFVETFGEPAPTQTWGFGSTSAAGTRGLTRSNPGVDYPSTSTGINANANEWADPAKEFGGWQVPDPLTEGQKERVKAYFQANPNLTYQDPEWRHFFVQQVYTGKTAPGSNSTEEVAAAGGTKYSGKDLNLLTVGENEQHINNFNAGTCSSTSVLDNGQNVGGSSHNDQIMLMVNIDDTQCFGYHNTGMSLQRNDKAALVAASVIDEWAAKNNNPGEAVVDKWNRSFLGFDFELFSLADSYAKNNGETIYAKMTDGQNGGLQYVWDGTKVLKRGSASAESNNSGDLTSNLANGWIWNNGIESLSNENGVVVYKSKQWGGCGFGLSDADWSTYDKLVYELAEDSPFKVKLGIKDRNAGEKTVEIEAGTKTLEFNLNGQNLSKVYELYLQAYEAGTIKISKVYLVGDAPQVDYYESDYLVVNGNQVPFLKANMNQYGGSLYGGKDEALSDSEMKINKDGKDCFNMEKIKELVDAGYLPVKDKNLRTWVKWAGGDGYFSDWIVSLNRAKRIDEGGGVQAVTDSIRVIGEDLTVNQRSDFDFNDVVFDVYWTHTPGSPDNQTVKIIVRAAGGELPIYIGNGDKALEIHELFGAENPTRNITVKTMMNTTNGNHYYENPDGSINSNAYKCPVVLLEDDWWHGDNIQDIANSIQIRVYKPSTGSEFVLKAPKGEVPSKIAVGTDYEWCDERQDIDKKYPTDNVEFDGRFSEYVAGQHDWNTWYLQKK